MPLTVAYRGIDRYCERLQGEAPRRRPVRIEFCEGDILDLFDDWRRAVGVVQAQGDGRGVSTGAQARPHGPPRARRRAARREPRRSGRRRSSSTSKRLLAEIDRLSGEAKKARGEARAAILDRLAELDRGLVQAAAAELDREARRERPGERPRPSSAPFGSRLAPEVRAQAVEAAFERLVRESLGLPTVRYQ